MQLSRIAASLECELEGEGKVEISRVVGIEEAGPGDLTFLSNLLTFAASIVIIALSKQYLRKYRNRK